MECSVDEQPALEISKHLFTEFSQPECWEVFPELRQFLQKIKACGLLVGMISNFDERLGKTSNGELPSVMVIHSISLGNRPDSRRTRFAFFLWLCAGVLQGKASKARETVSLANIPSCSILQNTLLHRIFMNALRLAGVRPEEACHIGDSYVSKDCWWLWLLLRGYSWRSWTILQPNK